jgi:uncharacterized repeat protein (TIGR01451 family)
MGRSCSSTTLAIRVLVTVLTLAAAAGAAADTILLSNLAQPADEPSPASICGSVWDAAPFITGDQAALLSSVRLAATTLYGQGTFSVTVYSDKNGLPNVPVQNGLLNGPARPGGTGVPYYVPGELHLAPNTRYWLVASTDQPTCPSGMGYGWYMTSSWDYSGYAGWVLPHYGAYTMDAGVTWVSTEGAMIPSPFFFELSGTVLAEALPALSISDATAPAGDPGTNAQVFQVRLSRPSLTPVSVDFRTVAGWGSTNDLDPATGTVTFAPGTTNQTFTIRIAAGSTITTNQCFLVQLANPTTNAVLDSFESLGTFLTNAPLPEVLVMSAAVKEGNLHNPNLLAMVRLSRPSATPVSVDFSTVDLSAVAGQDFVATSGTLLLSGPYPLTRWVPVSVLANVIAEPDKTLALQLGNPTNCVISLTQGIMTILNDDGLPGMVDHFSIVTNGQALGGIPCPVTVTALDASGNVVSSFSDRVFFMAGYSNSPPQHFDFEEGDFCEWTPLNASQQPGPYEMRQLDVTQPGVTNFAFRISPNIGSDGIQRMLNLEGGQGYYISVSFAQALDSGGNNGATTARVVMDAVQYAAASFGYMDYGQILRTNATFYYNSWYTYPRFFSLQFDRPYFEANVGAYADDVVASPVQFKSVWSGPFTNGVWSGPVTFSGQATDVLLFAEDVERHLGHSQPLTVLPTPNLAIGTALAAGLSRVGEPLTFTVSATNNGEAAASGAVISNDFSPGMLVSSAISSLGTCAISGTNVICNVGSIAVGQTAVLTIVARATDTNVMSFASVISCIEPDPDLSNNSAQRTFSVGLPGLRSASVSVHGAPGGTNLVFPVWIGGPFVQPVSVQYRTWAGVNPPPGDFIQTNGTLVFQPGMTNLAVTVAVLDDGVYEGTQYCDLDLENLSNAVFLNGTSFSGTITDNDPPPTLTIDDVGFVEGDAGTTNAVFVVHLSGATAIPASVQFTTLNGTALAGSDYYSTNGTLTFPPGTNTQTIIVQVRGNTVNEPDESFYVRLSNPLDATIARTQATGTITNDDLVAGRLDHFDWAPVFSPQIPNRLVPISISAKDAFGQVLTNFTGTVPLSAATSGGATNLGLAPLSAGTFAAGVWTNTISFTNTGAQVVLRVDDGFEHIGLSNPFDVLARFPLALALPPAANENDGALLNQARVWLPLPETNDVLVPLATTNLNLIAVPDSVVIPAGQTSAVFTISVLDNALLDGTRTAYLSTVSTQYSNTTASMSIYDNETASLSVTLPAQIAEATSSPKAGYGIATMSAMPDASIRATLTSSKPSRLQVPASVTIAPGTNAAIFILTAPDNNLLDGNESITVTASVQNWASGSAAITVTDNEPYTTELRSTYVGNQGAFEEGLGTVTNAVVLTLGGRTVSNLVFNLASSDTSELLVPPSVTVPAGTNTAYFNVTIVDDSETDGPQLVHISASAPGFTNANLTVTVLDNDLHHYNFGTLSGRRTSGVPFQISVSAADISNRFLIKYTGALFLRAVGSREPFAIAITNVTGWVRGTWTGSVVIDSPYAQTVYVQAMDLLGHTGQSAAINLGLPDWAGTPSILQTHVAGSDVVVSFQTVAGTYYALESTADLLVGPWLPVGTEALGDGGIQSLTDPGGAIAKGGFYRLRLHR